MTRTLACAVGCFVLASWGSRARADTKSACIAAADRGQQLRDSMDLRSAREQFLTCAADACPAIVRKQCAQWAAAVEQSMPTVVLGATNAGQRVGDVRVLVDGALLAERLDGQAVPINPGEHAFRFERAGARPVERKVVVREGEKLQPIDAVFEAPPTAAPPASAPSLLPPATPPLQPERSGGTGTGQRVVGLIAGGLGLVGLGVGSYFGLHARALYQDATTHCASPSSCNSQGVSGGDDAHKAAAISTGFFVAGGVLLAAGAVLYFTAPSGSPAPVRSLSAGALVGASMAGLRVGGTW